MTGERWKWLIVGILVAAAFASAAIAHSRLPDRIPTHWNIRGEVDGHGSRSSIFLMPCVMLFLLGLFAALPVLSPRPFSVDSFRPAYLGILVVTIAMMGYLHGVILYASFNPVLPIGRLLVGGLMFGLAGMGNLMGKVRRNLYVGIRTPWTLANDRVWNDTHRVAAWLMTAGGVLGGLICVVGLPIPAAFVPLAVSVVHPIYFSYRQYKRLERAGQLETEPT